MQQLCRGVDDFTGFQNNTLPLGAVINFAFKHLHDHRVYAVMFVPRLTGCQLHQGDAAAIGIKDFLCLRLSLKRGENFGELWENNHTPFVGTRHEF